MILISYSLFSFISILLVLLVTALISLIVLPNFIAYAAYDFTRTQYYDLSSMYGVQAVLEMPNPLDFSVGLTPAPLPSPMPKSAMMARAIPAVATQISVKKNIPSVSSGQIEPYIEKYGNEYGVDKDLLRQMADCESDFNPNAISGPAEEAVRTTAFKVSRDGVGAWPVCGNRQHLDTSSVFP